MSQLQPITLAFEGDEYKVKKEDGIWGLIEVVEDVITFFELAPSLAKGKYPTAKIFRAYAAALTYAGRKTTANEVRQVSSYEDMGKMAGALANLLMLAQPGADIDLGEAAASAKETEESAEQLKKKAEAG